MAHAPARRAPTSLAPAPLDPPVGMVVAAFAAVYVVWGSTYLGIRFAIESLPPLFMAAVRFLIAGGLLYAWTAARGCSRPRGTEWRAAAIAGGLMLGGGNGAVVVAEQWVPSGITALLVASVPLWLVVLDALFGSRVRPSRRAQVGLLVGFGGVALLGGSPGVGAAGTHELLGMLLVIGGSASWAVGSLYLRYAAVPDHPMRWVSMQMIMGGVVLGALSLVTGDSARFHASEVTLKSGAALLYLIAVGAIVGYSAYVWLLRVSTPARVGTYAYVNPAIALVLGWALAGEPVTPRSLAAAAVIVGSVVVIVSERRASSVRGVRLERKADDADGPTR